MSTGSFWLEINVNMFTPNQQIREREVHILREWFPSRKKLRRKIMNTSNQLHCNQGFSYGELKRRINKQQASLPLVRLLGILLQLFSDDLIKLTKFRRDVFSTTDFRKTLISRKLRKIPTQLKFPNFLLAKNQLLFCFLVYFKKVDSISQNVDSSPSVFQFPVNTFSPKNFRENNRTFSRHVECSFDNTSRTIQPNSEDVFDSQFFPNVSSKKSSWHVECNFNHTSGEYLVKNQKQFIN